MLHFGDMRTRAAFHRLFRTVLLKGAYVAAQRAGVRVPHRFAIVLEGGDRPGSHDDVAAAADALYREDGLFAPRIDVAVGTIAGERCDVRVRTAEGEPCAFDACWNKPPGYGPFRLVHEVAFNGSARIVDGA